MDKQHDDDYRAASYSRCIVFLVDYDNHKKSKKDNSPGGEKLMGLFGHRLLNMGHVNHLSVIISGRSF